MTEAMTTFDAGPASSIRAYRLPTIFWLWRYCCRSWPAVFLIIVVTGVLVGLASVPLIGLITVLWLAAGLHGTGLEAWPFVELWVVPLCVGAVFAIRRDSWGWAVVLALCAALIREQAVLVLLGRSVAAWRYRRTVWPWLASVAAWSAFLAWHISQVRPYLVPVGREQPLLGGGGLDSVAAMAGPYTYGVGLAVVVYALWRTRWTPGWWMVSPMLILIPLAGLVLDRNYWGFLVLPTALALLGQLFADVEPDGIPGDIDEDIVRVPDSEIVLVQR
jgi:hypothetical protein